MKRPDLTPELKERFYAQYWGQYVEQYEGQEEYGPFKPLNSRTPRVEFSYLNLRPISSITDEELIEVAQCLMHILWHFDGIKPYFRVERKQHLIKVSEKYNTRTFVIDMLDGQCLSYDEHDLSGSGNELWAYQKLLSLGFALPFMGYSVEELMQIRWIKLTEP